MEKQKLSLVGAKECRKAINDNPSYKVFKRSGFAYRGAKEQEDDKQPRKEFVSQEMRSRVLTFEERMERFYNWAAAIDIEIDHDKKEIHINGFSENDMW